MSTSNNIMNDRLTIKDIIFTKALPNYNIPVPTDGYKVFPCTDCGDKFIFESSYEYHINRKSLKISYFCRHCTKVIVFYNRCKLLSHIRSHAFKTATITVSDLQIEMLPLEHFNLSILSDPQIIAKNNNVVQPQRYVCHECNKPINKLGVIFKDRAAHYMQNTSVTHSCPICMFLLPTICALEAHLRIHLNIPPFFCPECGMHLSNKVASYPFDHDCEGFKMMKSATRLECKIQSCKELFHPDNYKQHFMSHLKKVYRCSFCLQLWYKEPLTTCSLCKNGKLSSYFQCPKCPHKLFVESLIEGHVNSHCYAKDKVSEQSYPCIICKVTYKQMYSLVNHHVNIHSSANMKNLLSKYFKASTASSRQKGRKHVYHRVVKKCSKCLRSFTYRCIYENIKKLPNDCPYKCISNTETESAEISDKIDEDLEIVCFLCKGKITQNWNNIKAHYAEFHKNHKCLDVQVLVKRLDKKLLPKKSKNSKFKSAMVKNKSKKNKLQGNKVVLNEEKDDESEELPKNPHVCIICNHNCENSENLEIHMITHRDPCMAYQCLECGKCFVVKPSFSTHLLLEHSITDVEDYINRKPCYNESALLKNQEVKSNDQPLKENQCRVCREQFETSHNLEKHFRVHGMAFLMKNAHKNNSSP